MLEEMSRVRVVDTQEDTIVVYSSDQYVCLMKLFPMCQHEGDIPPGDYRRFHLRFYIPREYFTDARKKISEILVMTNGLDEFEYYTLYDELGSRFASNGLPAVLLPLPDHLNRHTKFRIPKPVGRQLMEKPSNILMETPIKLYQRFLQFKDELQQLRNHIQFDGCSEPAGACCFFQYFFGPNVKISYLGYSLGAAAILSDFLESEASLNACFLLNGAIKLDDINSEKIIPQDKWETFIANLKTDYRGLSDTNKIFEAVFLGQYMDHTTDLLHQHARRVLFMYGGQDSLVSYKNLEKIAPKSGATLLVLPGINHFLAIDEQWKKWIGLVVQVILEFKENAVRETITEEQLKRQYIKLTEDPNGLSDSALMAIQSQNYRAGLIGMDPRELIAKDEIKQKVRDSIKGKPRDELPLGLMLYQANMITIEELLAALDRHATYGTRIGDILVEELGVVTREQLEAFASTQKKAAGN